MLLFLKYFSKLKDKEKEKKNENSSLNPDIIGVPVPLEMWLLDLLLICFAKTFLERLRESEINKIK